MSFCRGAKMSKMLRSLFILLIFTPLYADAAQYATPPEIDKDYQVPDLTADGDIMLRKFKLLAARAEKLKRDQDNSDIDDLLKDLFLPESSKQFQRYYYRELTLAKTPKRAPLWLNLAGHYLNQGRLQDAATAAYMAYRRGAGRPQQADALRLMGESYVEQGELRQGFNLLALSLRLNDNEETKRRLKVIRERFFLTVRDIALNVEQVAPNACIVFSKKLKPGQHAEDYVVVSRKNRPLADIDVSLSDDRICINGLEYGATYEVEVKPGLKGANNTLLDQGTRRSFTIHDRQSRASFDKAGYVISRTKDNLAPLTTVNVEKLKLELYLIHDRNLVNGAQNNLFQNLNSYEANAIRQQSGALVWQGEIDIAGERNREIKTLLPISDMMTKKENGVYVLIAREPKKEGENDWRYRQKNQASQWLLVSDMGLMSFKGKDGLHVMVRSLNSAEPLKNVTVHLIARNNKILGAATSDRRGIAHFPDSLICGKGGDEPALITAEGGADDYNFLKLANNYLDLSERGVAGRPAPGKQDAFLYTDRGVYRPGENIKLSALLRDPESRAIGSLPLTFRVRKPDGGILLEKTLAGDDLGGYALEIPLSAAALPGHYAVTAFLTKSSAALGHVAFQVEDFVPQRIRARLTTGEKWLEPSKKAELGLKATFLYGPPAAGLKTETHITLRRNPRPYDAYQDYHFGLVEEDFYSKSLAPVEGVTDDLGRSVISLDLKDIPDTTQPMLAYIQSYVMDVSGRPVDAKTALALRPRDVEVGLKPAFAGSLSAGEDAAFDVIALDRSGKPVAGRAVAYQLVREDYYYSWYRTGDQWNSRRNISDTVVETGDVTTGAEGMAHIQHRTQDGRYRLNILDKHGASAASSRYYVGWWSSGALPNVPDELELSLKDNAVDDGEVIRAFVKAPFSGRATVMIVNDRLRLTREISLPAEGREISVKADRDWGPGAYLMITAFRPGAGEVSKLPVRAMNLAWFSIDRERRSATIKIDVPDSVMPRQTVTLPITLKDSAVGDRKMRLTLAAVDEGILGLTNFQSPDPLAHYLSRRQLGMELADLYGRLIRPVEGVRGQLRTGGDMAMMATEAKLREAADMTADENVAGVQTKTVKTVALYQRDIEFDANGKGEVTLELPDFNGRLRLMAVAYGREIVGQGGQQLIVRDPVVADLLLPRFLAPGDQAETTLSLHNLSGRERRFTIALEHDAGLAVSGETAMSVTLADGQRLERIISLQADRLGDSRLALVVKTDGLPDVRRQWDIAVRPAQPFVTRRAVSYLASGDHAALSREDIAGALDGTLSANVTLTDRPDYNVPDLLDSLYLYPYGCGEQTASRVLPLLYYGDVAARWKKEYDPLTIRRTIDKAIRHLLDLQKHDGSFALWRATGQTHPWLTAYIFEFLSRARERDIEVPAAAYDHARRWLMTYAGRRAPSDPHVMAYIHYVLARIGDINPSDVRYFADTLGVKIETKIGLGHLAAALKLVGENHISEEFFLRALSTNRPDGRKGRWFKDFGSDLRDGAALAALIAEAAPGETRQLRIAEALDREFDRRKYFSTQEQAWLLLASHAMSRAASDGFQVAVNQKALPRSNAPLRYSLKAPAIEAGFDVKNIGKTPVRLIRSIRAVPSEPLKPASQGFDITRSFHTLDGEAADLGNIKQNDMLVVVLQGRSENNIDHEALIVDLLPAGFEIENAAIGGFEGGDRLKFLPRKSAFLYEAARDDRYIAALNLESSSRTFATSYIVRAVTPGTYKLPGVFVEDMYKPQYHARGASASVTIRK